MENDSQAEGEKERGEKKEKDEKAALNTARKLYIGVIITLWRHL